MIIIIRPQVRNIKQGILIGLSRNRKSYSFHLIEVTLLLWKTKYKQQNT